MNKSYNLITVLGHTAAGKTKIAVHIAGILNTEIISADSRQVYKNMDLGTGKDLNEYYYNNKKIKHHLIDILEAGSKYNVYEFQKDFFNVYNKLKANNIIPVMCGGTGMYIESVLNAYKLIHVPVNEDLRNKLEKLNLSELEQILKSFKKPHNKSDLDTKKRAIRAIEIQEYYKNKADKEELNNIPKIKSLNIGVKYPRDIRRKRITERLKSRLNEGMIEETEELLKNGVSHDTLQYYGLEYKFLSYYISGEIDYNTMFEKLNTAIHQFAKRQMTWFRKMEKNEHKIHWIDTEKPMELSINEILNKHL